MKSLFIQILLIVSTKLAANAQPTQTVRGSISDALSESIPGATIVLQSNDTLISAITDSTGNFTIERVPLGIYEAEFRCMGFEPSQISPLYVNSGKQTTVDIQLSESVKQVDEIVVKSAARGRPLNTYTMVSGITLSTEETSRMAGAMSDPARLATVHAGVADATAESNSIVVRGNAPTGTVYRVEGIEVLNPNHFYGEDMLGGGFVSIVNSQVVGDSDFLTGAFSAEYGDALSAVLDLNIRKGNDSEYEHSFKAGVLGITASSEGPLKKQSGASYLVNYRYSTFGLADAFLPENEGLPVYQDMTVKCNFPIGKHELSVWGSGGIDDYKYGTLNKSEGFVINDQSSTGFAGIKYKQRLNPTTYLHTTLLANASTKTNRYYEQAESPKHTLTEKLDYVNGKYVLAPTLVKRFGERHSNKTGVKLSSFFSEIKNERAPERTQDLEQITNYSGRTGRLQAFTQSKFRLTKKLYINAGLHSQHLLLNSETTLEPRLSGRYQVSSRFALSGGYGLHSQMQMITIYFLESKNTTGKRLPNKNVRFSKANHFVICGELKLTENSRLKIEPFYQYLYDIPVVADSSFSLINLEDINTFNEQLENKGTGRNVGADITLERFYRNGFYFLVTASVFDSKYRGGDGKWRNTKYNKNFVGNILSGKEWAIKQKRIIGINGRIQVKRGDRTSPVNEEASQQQQAVVYDDSKLYERQFPSSFRFDMSISHRRNYNKISSVISLQVINLLGNAMMYQDQFNTQTNSHELAEERTSLPNLSWKIEF